MDLARENILERLQRAEQALRECREENRIAFELSGVGQVIGDPENGRLLRVNRAFCQMLGYEEKELLRLTVRDLSHPDDRDVFARDFYPRIRRGEISEYTTDKRYIHKNGQIVWVAINASMLPDHAGQPRRIAAVIQDITARKNAEAAALESNTELRAIFENSVDAICVYEGEFHAMVNPAYVKLFGYDTAEELIGRPGVDLIAPSERPLIRERIERRMRGETVPSFYVSSGLRRDGTEFDLEIHASHFDLAGARFRLCVLRDVTEKNLAAQRLKEAHDQLERRVAERTAELTLANERLQRESRTRKRLEAQLRAATEREQERIGRDLHDGLGQHLAGIAYFLSALERRTAATAPDLSAELDNVSKMLNRAVAQTREIAHGLHPPELQDGLFVALQDLAQRTQQSFPVICRFCAERDVSVRKGDALHLYRIAQEAVTNAFTHGHATVIDIKVKVAAKTLTLVISDNGLGLAADYEKTHGLGLQTIRNRARLLCGSCEVKSGKNGGTVVTCRVPLRRSSLRVAK